MSAWSLGHRHHNLLRHSNHSPLRKASESQGYASIYGPGTSQPPGSSVRWITALANLTTWFTCIFQRGEMKSLNQSVFSSQYSKTVCDKQHCEGTKLLFPLRTDSSPRFFFVSKSSQQCFASSSCWYVLLSLAYSLTHLLEHKMILFSYEWSAFWGQNFSEVKEPCWPVQMWPDVTWSHFHLFSIYVHKMKELTQYYPPPASSSSCVQRGVKHVVLPPI